MWTVYSPCNKVDWGVYRNHSSMWALSRKCCLNHSAFYGRSWCRGTSSWVRVPFRKHGMLSSRVYIVSLYDCFYYTFWTKKYFATRLNLLVDHHKLKCPVKMSDCKGWKLQLIFVPTMSSEPLNHSETKLAWRCINTSKDYIIFDSSHNVRPNFKVKRLVWLKRDCFHTIFLNC